MPPLDPQMTTTRPSSGLQADVGTSGSGSGSGETSGAAGTVGRAPQDTFIQVQENRLEQYAAAMIATSSAVPFIMIAVTLALYIGWPSNLTWLSNRWVLGFGVLAGGLGWILMAIVAQPFVVIEHARRAVYSEFQSRFAILQSQTGAIQEKLRTDHTRPYSPFRDEEEEKYYWGNIYPRLRAAESELHAHLGRLGTALGEPRPSERDGAIPVGGANVYVQPRVPPIETPTRING